MCLYRIFFLWQYEYFIIDHQPHAWARLCAVNFDFCLNIVKKRGSSVVLTLFSIFCHGNFPCDGLCC
jgi:hypothetical protein